MMKILSIVLLLSSALGAVEAFSAGWKTSSVMPSSTSLYAEETRRSWLQSSSAILLGSAISSSTSPQAAFAKVATDASSLDADLPPVSFYLCFLLRSFSICSLLLIIASMYVMSLPGCSKILPPIQILSSTGS